MAHPTEDPQAGPVPATEERRGRLHRARDWSHRGRTRRLLWQATVLGVGSGLILAGIAMLVLPGPGWAAIILGLVVLASEYAWAHRVLQPVRRVADRAAQSALDPERRLRNLVIAGVAVAVAVAVVAWYVNVYGVSLDGVRWLPGI